jgi:pimeloyl-ACP methyl ester carboxylesterase
MFTDDAVVTRAGLRLAVRDFGGDGPGVVLLHGLSSNLAIWDLVAGRLAGRFHVVAYDQRSHGLSGGAEGDFRYESLVADLEAVIDARTLRDPVVVGHSWGASVAVEYAGRHPQCPGIVCVDGGVFDMQAMGAGWEQTEELLTPPRLIGPGEKVLERIRTEQAFLEWDRVEPVVRRSRIATSDGLTRPRLDFDEHMLVVRRIWEHRTWDAYARVRCPVLLVLARGVERNNREQGFVAVKQLAADQLVQRHPHIRVEWVSSVHDIPLASPAELAQLIEGFVTASG